MYKEETIDNELLSLIEENNEDAFYELVGRYNAKINALVSKYKLKGKSIGLDISDLYQEGLLGLIQAMRTFDKEKDASFKTYATILIERNIIDIIKHNNRSKFKSLNSALSLDKMNEMDDLNLYNKLEVSVSSPEKELINIEEEEELKKELTEFELKVFLLKMEGKSNKEISIILDKNTRSIENTIQRIKNKIKEKI